MRLNELQTSVETAIFCGAMEENHFDSLLKFGLENIELCCVPHRFDYNDPEYLEQMCRYLENSSINVVSMHLPFGNELDVSSPLEVIRNAACETIGRCFKIGRRLGCKIYVLHPGIAIPEEQSASILIDNAVDSIKRLADMLPESGTLAVENLLPGFLAALATQLREIVERVNHESVGYCIDIGHAHCCNQMAELFDVCADKIFNIHLHDNNGDYDSHLMPGEGNIDWQKVVSLIECSESKPLLTYELTNVKDAEQKLSCIDDNLKWLAAKNVGVPVS